MIGVETTLFSEKKLNKLDTAQRVKDFFENDFDHYLNLAGAHRTDISSPTMDITGISAHGINHQDASMAINIDAANCVLAVDHTISSCSNSGERPYGTILYYSYIKNLSNYVIAERLGYQMSRYYELKNRALVEFAERMELWRKRDNTSINTLCVFEEPISENRSFTGE